MIYLSLTVIVLLCIVYIITLTKTVKVQSKVIEEQKDVILKERIAHKYTQQKLDFYYKGYIDAASNGLVKVKPSIIEVEDIRPIEKVYELDDILSEISKKGIENVSKDKLDFLRKFGKR